MAQPRGFGSFDPTITTRFGPTGTEAMDALETGLQLGAQRGQQIARIIEQKRRAKPVSYTHLTLPTTPYV